MKLILASYNIKFIKDLGTAFEKLGAKVVDYVSSEEDLLQTLIRNPDVEGILIHSNLAKKHEDMRLDLLVDVLTGIKAEKRFQGINFTVLSDVQKGHPFLAELVEIGIYSIYCRNQTNINVDSLYKSFKFPTSISEAMHFRNVDASIQWRRTIQTARTVELKFSSENGLEGNKKSSLLNGAMKIFSKKNKLDTEIEESPKSDIEPDSEVIEDNNLSRVEVKKTNEDPPIIQTTDSKNEDVLNEQDTGKGSSGWNIQEKSLQKVFQPVGTVLIGVCGVEEHLGSTTAATAMANFLISQNHNVALVEGNFSQDFDRIHALSEGEQGIFNVNNFELLNIPHFKYRADMDLDKIMTSYDYVILDLGRLADSPLELEFGRAHVKCVVCSGDEWKQHWIDAFNREYGHYDGLNYIVPGAPDTVVKDLINRIDNENCMSFPILDSAYKLNESNKIEISSLLGKYMSVNKRKNGKEQLKTWSLVATTGMLISLVCYILFN